MADESVQPETKYCNKCRRSLPLSAFHKEKRYGTQTQCKECRARWQKEHKQKPEQKEYNRKRQLTYFRSKYGTDPEWGRHAR